MSNLYILVQEFNCPMRCMGCLYLRGYASNIDVVVKGSSWILCKEWFGNNVSMVSYGHIGVAANPAIQTAGWQIHTKLQKLHSEMRNKFSWVHQKIIYLIHNIDHSRTQPHENHKHDTSLIRFNEITINI